MEEEGKEKKNRKIKNAGKKILKNTIKTIIKFINFIINLIINFTVPTLIIIAVLIVISSIKYVIDTLDGSRNESEPRECRTCCL